MRLLLAGLVVAGCAVAAPAAAAGDGVLRTDPADGAWSRQVPVHVRLWFADARSAADAQVLLVTPESDAAQEVPRTVEGAVVTLAVPDDGPGAYRVVWVVGGPDGGAAGATAFRVGGALPAVDGGPATPPITIPRTGTGTNGTSDTAGTNGTSDTAGTGRGDLLGAGAGDRPGSGPSGRPATAAAPVPGTDRAPASPGGPRTRSSAPPTAAPPTAARTAVLPGGEGTGLLVTALAGLAVFAAAAHWSVRRGERLARRRARGRRVATS